MHDENQVQNFIEPRKKRDVLMSSLKVVNFKVCDVSKLLSRIKSLENRIAFGMKFRKWSSKLVLEYNVNSIVTFARLSQGFDVISEFRKRRSFRRWRLRKNWACLAYQALHSSVRQRISDLAEHANEHKHSRRQKTWRRFARSLRQAQIQKEFREVYSDYQMWTSQLYFFNLWKFRLGRRCDVHASRGNRWRKMVSSFSRTCLMKELKKQASVILKQRKWSDMAKRYAFLSAMANIRTVCPRVQQQWMWYGLVDAYVLETFRKRLSRDVERFSHKNMWMSLTKRVVHNRLLHTFERAQLVCSGSAKLRATVAKFLKNHVTDMLVQERTRRNEKIEQRENMERLRKAMIKWTSKAVVKSGLQRSVRSVFTSATNQYMLGVCNDAAMTIQRVFLKMLNRQHAKRRLLHFCFAEWRKLPTRITFNCVEFPQIAVACNFNLELQVSRVVKVQHYPLDELVSMRPAYEMKLRRQEVMIHKIAAERVSMFKIGLLPRPKVSAMKLYGCENGRQTTETMLELQSAIVEQEPIPTSLNLLAPLEIVTSSIVDGSCFLKDHCGGSEPEVDHEFIDAMSLRVTKRTLNKLFVPPFEESIDVALFTQKESVPELIDQYDELMFFDDLFVADFDILVDIERSIRPVDVVVPCSTPRALDVVPKALKRIDVSRIYKVAQEYATITPIQEYCAIDEPVFELDRCFLSDATAGFGLNKTQQPVLTLYDESFDYVRRLEHHALLIYDHTIHEEAADAIIGLEDVLAVASQNISISGIQSYTEIETILERKIVIDEERVSEPLDAVFNEIGLSVDGLETYERSVYQDEHMDEKVKIEWPIERLDITLSANALHSCISSKFDNCDDDFVSEQISQSTNLKILTKPEFDCLHYTGNFIHENAVAGIFRSAERNLIHTSKEVLNEDQLFDIAIPKINLSKKDVPAGEKIDLNSVFDLHLSSIEIQSPYIDPLLYASAIEEPETEEEDFTEDLLPYEEDVIFTLCELDGTALVEYETLELPEFDYLSEEFGSAMRFGREWTENASISRLIDCIQPDQPEEEDQFDDIDQVIAQICESTMSTISVDELAQWNVNCKPLSHCQIVECEDPPEVLPIVSFEVGFDGLEIHVPMEFVEFALPGSERVCGNVFDLQLLVCTEDIGFVNSVLTSVRNLTWDNVESEAFTNFVTFIDTVDPHVHDKDVNVTLMFLSCFTQKTHPMPQFFDNDLFNGIIEHAVQVSAERSCFTIYDSLSKSEPDRTIALDISDTIMLSLDSVFVDIVHNEVASRASAVNESISSCRVLSAPSIIGSMLDDVLGEFLQATPVIEFQPDLFDEIFNIPSISHVPVDIHIKCVRESLFMTPIPEKELPQYELCSCVEKMLDDVLRMECSAVLIASWLTPLNWSVNEKKDMNGQYILPPVVSETFSDLITNTLLSVCLQEACISVGSTRKVAAMPYVMAKEQIDLTESVLHESITSAYLNTIFAVLETNPPKSRIKRRRCNKQENSFDRYDIPKYVRDHILFSITQLAGECTADSAVAVMQQLRPCMQTSSSEDPRAFAIEAHDIGIDDVLGATVKSVVCESCSSIRQTLGSIQALETDKAKTYISNMLEETLDEMFANGLGSTKVSLDGINTELKRIIDNMVPIPDTKEILFNLFDNTILQFVPAPRSTESKKDFDPYNVPQFCAEQFRVVLDGALFGATLPLLDVRRTENVRDERMPLFVPPTNSIQELEESVLNMALYSAVHAADAISRLGSYAKLRKHRKLRNHHNEIPHPQRTDLPDYVIPPVLVDLLSSESIILPAFLHVGWDPVLIFDSGAGSSFSEEESAAETKGSDCIAYELPEQLVNTLGDEFLRGTVPMALSMSPVIGSVPCTERDHHVIDYTLPVEVQDALMSFVDSVSTLAVDIPKRQSQNMNPSQEVSYTPPDDLCNVIFDSIKSTIISAVALNPDVILTKKSKRKHRHKQRMETHTNDFPPYTIPKSIVEELSVLRQSDLSGIAIGSLTELDMRTSVTVEPAKQPSRVVIPYELPNHFLKEEFYGMNALIATVLCPDRIPFDITPIVLAPRDSTEHAKPDSSTMEYNIPPVINTETDAIVQMALINTLTRPDPFYLPKRHKRKHHSSIPPRKHLSGVKPVIEYQPPTSIRHETDTILSSLLGGCAVSNGVTLLTQFGQITTTMRM